MPTSPLSICRLAAFCGALFLLFATGAFAKTLSPAKTVVYYNGRVLTMEGDTPRYAQAVVVRGTRIAFVGGQKQALALAGAHAERHDLKGHVMVPGFIDTWGHFALVAQNTLGVNLAYFGNNPPHTKAQLLEKMQKEGRPFNGWLLGSGYAEAMLSDVDKMLKHDPKVRFGVYTHNDHGFKIAGMQVPTDGASQLRLGYFTQPYIDTTGFPKGWRGFAFYPQATIDKTARRLARA